MQQLLKSKRSSGILLHITSLPGPYGIGEIGKEAKLFIDNLADMGQQYWQILPTNFPENCDSPYDTNSAFAQNPYLISLDYLMNDDLIRKADLEPIPKFKKDIIEFEKLKDWKNPILKKVAYNFSIRNNKAEQKAYKEFCRENNFWLNDYASFMVIKSFQKKKSWQEWELGYKDMDKKSLDKIRFKFKDKIDEIMILQYLFNKQWKLLKSYANENGVEIIGDIPIYISYNSADVWSNSKLFKLNKRGSMKFQSGCPPDHFSSRGQLWGHPIYDWEKHLHSGFQWWKSRLSYALRFVDIVRIDHFNGLAKYWEVPIRNRTAKKGKWVYALGKELLSSMYKENKNSVQIIAEDLGAAAKDAEKIRKKFGIPGMTILQYEYFNNKKSFLNVEDTVLYTGTHDNDTIVGWYLDFLKKSSKKMVNLIPNFKYISKKESNWFFIDVALKSKAKVVIIPFQDIIGLGTNARMNIPGTTDTKNWTWRSSNKHLEEKLINRMKKLMQNAKRL